MMSDNIAISDLKAIAKKRGYDHVICFATKGRREFVATYGNTIEACDQAAQFGDKLKDILGWPTSLHAMPSRVRQFEARAEKAEAELAALREQTRWIPVSEGLPEDETRYTARMFKGRGYWTPLPTPPEAE